MRTIVLCYYFGIINKKKNYKLNTYIKKKYFNIYRRFYGLFIFHLKLENQKSTKLFEIEIQIF